MGSIPIGGSIFLNTGVNNMQDYQLRVVNEKDELDSKIERLRIAIETKPEFVKNDPLLAVQLPIMQDYSAILAQRIKAFKID